MSVGEIH